MEKPIPFSIESYNELVVQAGTHQIERENDNSPGRIVCTDYLSDQGTQLICLFKNSGGTESPMPFTLEGEPAVGITPGRLVIVPKPPVSLGWVAVYDAYNYQATTPLFDTAEQAISFCGVRKILSEPIQIFAKP